MITFTTEIMAQENPIGAFYFDSGVEHGIFIWDGSQTMTISDDYLYRDLVWSKDGRLAWGTYVPTNTPQIRVWDNGTIHDLNVPGEIIYDPIWADDGRLALVATSYNSTIASIYVWDGENVVYVGEQSTDSEMPEWSHDGRLAWTYDRDGEIYVWDGQDSITLPGNYTLEWSHDGRLAWYRCGKLYCRVRVWDGETTRVVYKGRRHPYKLVWSDDGQLAWTALPRDVGRSKIMVWDGQTLHQISRGWHYSPTPVWSADGQLAWLAREGDFYSRIYIWDGNSVSTLAAMPAESVAWSPDGKLAWVARTQNIEVWDGENIITINDKHNSWYFEPEWMENGWLMWREYTTPEVLDVFIWKPETEEKIKLRDLVGDYTSFPVWYYGD